MNRQEHERHGPRWSAGLLLSIIIFIPCFAAGYGLAKVVFHITGRPSELWVCVIAAMLGLGVFVLGTKLFLEFYWHIYPKNREWKDKRNDFLNITLEAMERIACGDFSVLLPVNEHEPFHELAESVNKMARELGSMEKLRQDFISNISHEIQSPLTSISGFAALLKDTSLSEKQRIHYIEVIETEAGRLSKLSDNLLRLSSLEGNDQPLAITSFALDRQIQNAVLILEPQWMSKHLELSASLEKITCSGDEELLTQVWINLLHNAVKFTPEGGEISITLECGNKEAICRISDTGTGFSEEERMHIFERFYKADKARERSLGGNGLGLSLVKKIVEMHDGQVSAESQPGKGSIFTVVLPLKK